jgi:hypothetical protein
MKNCGNKIKHTCAEKNYATCIHYEGNVPAFSGLASLVEAGGCITLEETTEDQYDILEDIKSEIDLSSLGNDCLTYVQEEGQNIVKNVLLKYEQEICDLKSKVSYLENEAICDKIITDCVDLSGIVDACEQPINTLGELLQYLLDNTQTP